ncbi:hypothetical protein Pmar_PMAR016968 [Perkinsus marinus ATCC 50983]|uniref:Uncharacterized protein n=1 Tax=Perkinsus marinus (strain ATCC 50983 / TXsc) TaxID=423536 RepID=C5LTM7_PERM5|nr:hypothetical protein Pmar_PMAR016968 [Perkinsus marinus ATCC 50983]EEQ99915.1 hypothetical protein Pmar_PMAR016968 [Perkinsus marinus ATCC 50983]|eukprot:XP_002767198.1 hypothetical protein Pmar_PMAR016968 [Perkinsus marinus ATCC 50983]
MDEARALFFENVPVEREEAEDQKEGEAADNDSAPETSAAERTRPVPCRGRIPHSAIHFTVLGKEGEEDACDVLLQDLGVEVFTLDTSESTGNDRMKELMRFEALRSYIERNGRPYNFLPSQEEVSKEVRQAMASHEKDRLAAEEVTDGLTEA